MFTGVELKTDVVIVVPLGGEERLNDERTGTLFNVIDLGPFDDLKESFA